MSSDLALHKELHRRLVEYRNKRGFNPAAWIQRKCAVLNAYMASNGLKVCVTNVSGGIDSAVVVALCSRAMQMPNSPIVKNIGLCQPICSSAWALERGQENIRSCGAVEVVVDQTEIFKQLSTTIETAVGIDGKDFARGQLRSYMRTPAAYYVAQLYSQGGTPAIVMGTGNMDEDGYLGYFCKAGDGVVDVQVISDLHKSEVFQVARELDVPVKTLQAPPSADLWDGQTDEEELGFPYDFVELYTGWCMRLSDGERESFLHSLSTTARQQYEKYRDACDKVNRRNLHKISGIINL
ncbi:NAD+ synthase [Trypanosoma rangeli]|uniref:NAD+ synthase n=1 Tax=Trypanosoma rangeli TaxID=5698 RepID=A0A422NLB6_TRYRA|nr:NAD+ synthase [Trypanosoma rangeli]RNF06236.1 NAD+ synthase [Trypanosoma rangeli]|eukprot:RNF06236.1 NAD+ synthase [Trypanosoma rangeli]